MGESARLAPSCSFYVVTSAILGCKSFKNVGNLWIILLKSYKSKDLTSFLDQFYPSSMRCSLNLHLRSAHEKPQQPNRFDSLTDPVFGYTQTTLNADATFEFCQHDCDKELLPTIPLCLKAKLKTRLLPKMLPWTSKLHVYERY